MKKHGSPYRYWNQYNVESELIDLHLLFVGADKLIIFKGLPIHFCFCSLIKVLLSINLSVFAFKQPTLCKGDKINAALFKMFQDTPLGLLLNKKIFMPHVHHIFLQKKNNNKKNSHAVIPILKNMDK